MAVANGFSSNMAKVEVGGRRYLARVSADFDMGERVEPNKVRVRLHLSLSREEYESLSSMIDGLGPSRLRIFGARLIISGLFIWLSSMVTIEDGLYVAEVEMLSTGEVEVLTWEEGERI